MTASLEIKNIPLINERITVKSKLFFEDDQKKREERMKKKSHEIKEEINLNMKFHPKNALKGEK